MNTSEVWGINDIPTYMQKGSRGPVVNAVLLVLAGWYTSRFDDASGLEPDGEYGNRLHTVVSEFQKEWGLEEDGHFGPATRRAFVDEFGFNLQTLAAITGPGVTVFVQPDGDEIHWSLEKSETTSIAA